MQKADTLIKTLFGTDGIRGPLGTAPFTTTELPMLAAAYASWLVNNYQMPLTIALADDTRASASFIKHTFLAALHAYGVVTYDAGVLPTPALITLIAANPAINGGIMISASHNPHTDNGIKFIASYGKKMSKHHEREISSLFFDGCIQPPSYTSFGTYTRWNAARTLYTEQIYSRFPPKFLSGLCIVLDCADGAASELAPQIFAHFGANVITIHNIPTGTNINNHCGSLYPTHLQQAVISHMADIGFAFDGDADRVVAITKTGTIKTGDDILALLSQHPSYITQSALVGTIMTNQGLSQYLENQGKRLIRTAVGDAHVVTALEDNQLLLGGEPSGHIITRDYLDAADGIMTALKITETLLHTKNWDLETFKPFPQTLINMPVRHKRNLDETPIDGIIQKYQSLLKQGRLVVRYSGTEALLRIMVEEQELVDAQAICNQLAHALAKELN